MIKWLRPALKQLSIYWNRNDKYHPDFIVETATTIYMVEIKASNEVNDIDTQAKAKAAIKYCNYATEFTLEHGGKQWQYALIAHDKVSKNSSFGGLVRQNVMEE